MIVDDKEDIRELVKEGLEHIDKEYSVVSICSGEDCVHSLKAEDPPDIILLDIMMPEMDGWNVFAVIKENPTWRNIPIIFLSAKSDPYSKGIGQMGADDYIEKPFSVKELKERIEKVLQEKK